MPTLISKPTRIAAAGNKPKIIEEFIGRVNTGESRLSIAQMRSPGGWVEPGQTPEFDEFTVVLKGTLRVTHRDGSDGCHCRAGDPDARRRMGAIQYSGPRGSGLHCGLSAGVFAPDRAPRFELEALARGLLVDAR